MTDFQPLGRAADIIRQCVDPDWAICGVPCSVLEPWLAHIPGFCDRCLIAPNEGQATAFCAGAWLAGRTGVAFMQNSGLGNTINALTSLIIPFEIPIVCLVGWRGLPGANDEPQHRMMGSISKSILSLCGVQTFVPVDPRESTAGLAIGIHTGVRNRRACALLLPPIADEVPRRPIDRRAQRVDSHLCFDSAPYDEGSQRLSTRTVLQTCCEEFDSTAIFVATTGHCSRELFAMADGPNKFYMVGSMGHASALALGIAAESNRPVIVIDGDGALLMHLGNMAFVGAFRGGCLTHVLLNNGIHESTGGQPIAGTGSIAFHAIAQLCGYLNSWRCHRIDDLRSYLRCAYNTAGPSFIEVLVAPRSKGPLPRIPDSLPDIAMRTRTHIAGTPKVLKQTDLNNRCSTEGGIP